MTAIFQWLHATLFGYMARMGMVLFEGDPSEFTKALKILQDDLKAEAAKLAKDESGKILPLLDAQKIKVDELLQEQGKLLTAQQALEQKLLAAEKKTEKAEPKTLGELVTDAPEMKAFLGKGQFSGKWQVRADGISRKAVTSAVDSAGPGIAPDFRSTVMPLGRQDLTVRSLMAPGSTSAPAITYVRELGFTNSAAATAEGAKKPESTLSLEAVVQSVITIAHFIKMSVQILEDIPALQSFISERMRYGLALAEEVQLLKGSGVGLNLKGIYTQATAYDAATIPAPPAATIIDKIRVMILQTYLSHFPATGIVLNPIDWAVIEMMKDTTGRYLIGDPQGVLNPRLWGLPVVGSQSMSPSTQLVGAFRTMSQIFDRTGVSVDFATQNEDDFVKNLVTVRIEERLASAVYRPEAFIKT